MGFFKYDTTEIQKQEESWKKLRIAQASCCVNARLKPSEKYDPIIKFFKKYADTVWGDSSRKEIEVISFLEYIWMLQELDEIEKDNEKIDKDFEECLKNMRCKNAN